MTGPEFKAWRDNIELAVHSIQSRYLIVWTGELAFKRRRPALSLLCVPFMN
jgi:hypothetical protein